MSVTFNDIHAMIASRPALPEARACEDALTAMLSRVQGCCAPAIKHPRAAYYASAYSAADIAVTQEKLQEVTNGQHAVQQFCAKLNADLRVYELNTAQALPENGLSEAEAAQLIAYGLMAVDEHVDCLMMGSLSQGFKAACEAFAQAMTQQPDADVLALAARHGGQDMCALIGAMLSARMAKIPVVAGPHTGDVLQQVAARLFGKNDSTLVIASATSVPETVRVLHYTYQTIGDMIASEGRDAPSALQDCAGCAAAA